MAATPPALPDELRSPSSSASHPTTRPASSAPPSSARPGATTSPARIPPPPPRAPPGTPRARLPPPGPEKQARPPLQPQHRFVLVPRRTSRAPEVPPDGEKLL